MFLALRTTVERFMWGRIRSALEAVCFLVARRVSFRRRLDDDVVSFCYYWSYIMYAFSLVS